MGEAESGGLDEAVQRESAGIGDTAQPYAPGTTAPALHSNRDLRFLAAGASTMCSRLLAAHIGFIDFYLAAEQVTTWDHHCPAQLVQPRPRRLIAAQPEQSLQAQREAPFLVEHTCQAAANHWLRGERVPANIVPAVTETRLPQPAQTREPRPRLAAHERNEPQLGQTNPSPHRSRSR